MIAGVDIGGTKTLIGVFDNTGKIVDTKRFPTPQNYKEFLDTLKAEISTFSKDIAEIVVAAPGRIDRQKNTVVSYGNLPWKNTPLKDDIEKITGKSVRIENDAKLAALSESKNLQNEFDKILYITFSTGIGAGLVYKGSLDEAMLDSEAGQMMLPNTDKNGEMTRWELIASGKALYQKYGKKAEEIEDKAIWDEFTKKMAIGIIELCAVIEPDAIIIGGGVGTHFNKYGTFLTRSVKNGLPYMVKTPQIFGASNAEQASLLGCYEYSKGK
jgi:glucokinase